MAKLWLSPAKINLFLHVISKRDDGYHNIQTIFQLLDLCDEITFKVNANSTIKRIYGNNNIEHNQDLIVRSAKLLQQYANISLGVDIGIKKNIPIGGGLGGGSSNAATTLIALNELWNLNLSIDKLTKIGAKIGADVALFINGYSAWGEGIGDILTPIKLPKYYFLVVYINKNISTKEIFSHKALTKTPSIGKIASFSELVNPHNDCLDAAIIMHSEILQALDYLNSSKNHIDTARMSGTGSCVFVAFEKIEDIDLALINMPKKWLGIKTKAINTSPMCNWAVAKR